MSPQTLAREHEQEVKRGERFEFGKNWHRFLASIDEERIAAAGKCFADMFGRADLQGHTFLDVGSGSGLSSLVARRLGARVHSFDYDPSSVACSQELRARFASNDDQWVVERGSILDAEYLSGLPRFDIVHSWGVLHHTGQMWHALDNAAALVAERGYFFVSLYNDQGRTSRRWRVLKHAYCKLPRSLRWLILGPSALRIWGPQIVRDCFNLTPLRHWNEYRHERGMSPWYDVVDWVGGYPFEVAKPEQVFLALRKRGFELLNMKTCAGGRGCNEFVFRRVR